MCLFTYKAPTNVDKHVYQHCSISLSLSLSLSIYFSLSLYIYIYIHTCIVRNSLGWLETRLAQIMLNYLKLAYFVHRVHRK